MGRSTKARMGTAARLGAGTALAGALLVANPGTASAESQSDYRIEEFSFGSSTRQYTCRIQVFSYTYAEFDSAGAETTLLREGSDPLCFEDYHQVSVTATYTDVNGQQERVTAHSEENVILEISDFGSGFVAEHHAVFSVCRCGTPVYRTAPK